MKSAYRNQSFFLDSLKCIQVLPTDLRRHHSRTFRISYFAIQFDAMAVCVFAREKTISLMDSNQKILKKTITIYWLLLQDLTTKYNSKRSPLFPSPISK